MEKFEKKDKYLVLKLDDIKKYVPEELGYFLYQAMNKIVEGRRKDLKPINGYVVVNEAEPYAKKVWIMIEEQILWDRRTEIKKRLIQQLLQL